MGVDGPTDRDDEAMVLKEDATYLLISEPAATLPASPVKISLKMYPHPARPSTKPMIAGRPGKNRWFSPRYPHVSITTVAIIKRQNMPELMFGFTAARIRLNSIICRGTVIDQSMYR